MKSFATNVLALLILTGAFALGLAIGKNIGVRQTVHEAVEKGHAEYYITYENYFENMKRSWRWKRVHDRP